MGTEMSQYILNKPLPQSYILCPFGDGGSAVITQSASAMIFIFPLWGRKPYILYTIANVLRL